MEGTFCAFSRPRPAIISSHTTLVVPRISRIDIESMSNTLEGSSAEEHAIGTVDVDGFSYYVVDSDYSKGDRRGDGRFMSNFFTVGGMSAETNTNLRQSYRVKNKRDLQQTSYVEIEDPELCMMETVKPISVEIVQSRKNKRQNVAEEKKAVISLVDDVSTEGIEEEVSNNIIETSVTNEDTDDFDISLFGKGLRRPEEGIRCAGRQGTTRLLWLHEFFVVKDGTSSKRTGSVYQALQFLLGAHLPDGQVHNMTEDMRREIWVLGILHAPADHVRQGGVRNVGCYLFHSESDGGNARQVLLGNCPELVRIENGLKWHNIHAVSTQVPRVVHPQDVLIRRVHVAGRKNHYVCGVSAVEDIFANTYTLMVLPRTGFCMYPEERLGMEINSASMMWEDVEEIFSRIRGCMSAGRQGTSSATFTMPILETVYAFWRVRE